MTASLRSLARVSSWVTITVLLATSGASAQTPTVFNACVTVLTGIVYVPKPAGKCFLSSHTAISWTDGAGALRNGAAAGGDLSGSYPNPSVAKLRGTSVSADAPSDGYVLTFNGTTTMWEPRASASAATAANALKLGGHPAEDFLLVGGTAADAAKLDGKPGSDYATASALATETTARTSADNTLQTNVTTVSDAFNTHKTLLANSGGTINTAGNPVSWTELKDVPAGVISGGGGATKVACNGCTASGDDATATGFETEAMGPFSTAMGNKTKASSFAATAMGYGSKASNFAATAMGNFTEASNLAATAMGSHTTASGEYATAMGTKTTASGHQSTAMGTDASTNDHKGAFVYGDASEGRFLNATADNQFAVRAEGGTIFYSNWGLTAGVSLAPGGGAWETVSDVNRKAYFRDVSGEEVLAKIARMPVREWSYKAQDPSIRHLGPTAQDFHAAFGLGESDTTITTTDIDGIDLLAVQALEKRSERMQQENAALRARMADLERRLALIEAGVSR